MNCLRIPFCMTALVSLLLPGSLSAQTTAYRQFNLTAGSLGYRANQLSPSLINPWSVAFLPGGNFFVAENGAGIASGYGLSGLFDVGVLVPTPHGSTASHALPTSIVADPDGNFGLIGARYQFIVATEDGTLSGFSFANGDPGVATLALDQSGVSAVYTGMTIIHPVCCNPKLAVANFHDGTIEVRDVSLFALPGSFTDNNLPVGYAPYNIQTIGTKVLVTYAKQDAEKHNPVAGQGNGIVSIFDQDGNFIRRFVSDGGTLNIPAGIAQASSHFGPFAGDILIANYGDGAINVFDPNTGDLLGHLQDGEGNAITIPGIHSITVRAADGIGNPDSLYFVAGPNNGQDGVFGFLGAGPTTSTVVTAVPNAISGTSIDISAQIASSTGVPTGTVDFSDSGGAIGSADLIDGKATISYTVVGSGSHAISAEYRGVNIQFLPSIGETDVQVTASGPVVHLSSGRVAFADQPVGTTSAPQSLGITNVGDATLNINSAVTTGDFSMLSSNCASPVAAGASCTFNLKFHPTVAALRTGILSITDNSAGSSQVVNLSGTGIAVASGPCDAGRPIISSVSPVAVKQNSTGPMLTVSGCDFANGAALTWNGAARSTVFINSSQLTTTLTATDLSTFGTATVAVSNPATAGGNSAPVLFAIDTATPTSVTPNAPSLTIVAGSNGTVPLQVTGFSGAATGTCLNAPSGVSCSYDQSASNIGVQTSATTPKGTFQLTFVLTGKTSARGNSILAASFPWFGLPDLLIGTTLAASQIRRKQRWSKRHAIALGLPLAFCLVLSFSGCGGTSNMEVLTLPAQASTALSLTVQ